MKETSVTLTVANHGQLNIDFEPESSESSQGTGLNEAEWEELFEMVRQLHAAICGPHLAN